MVQLTFDNVHFFRDNPNVPSDLEMMPNLLNFFESNGTFLSNSHTPLIAHTADDILTTYTGLYGDRQGMPVSNSYQAYNTDGPNGTFNTTDPASSFAYWTDPVYDTAKTPSPAHDTNPNMVYAPVPPATAAQPVAPDTDHPRAVGAVHPGRLRRGRRVHGEPGAGEHTPSTSPRCSAPARPRSSSSPRTPTRSRTPRPRTTSASPCTAPRATRSAPPPRETEAARPRRRRPPSADVLPNEPGGYNGFQALFGHRYIAPQLGAGTDNVTHNGYQVTNSAGNLVDENGNQINGAFLTNHPGFPGFSPINASQSLAYMADMLESGVPVVNGYISDIHGNEHIPGRGRVQAAPRPRSAAAAPATSPRRSTTTRPSARSSSGWPRTASPRRTRSSC